MEDLKYEGIFEISWQDVVLTCNLVSVCPTVTVATLSPGHLPSTSPSVEQEQHKTCQAHLADVAECAGMRRGTHFLHSDAHSFGSLPTHEPPALVIFLDMEVLAVSLH